MTTGHDHTLDLSASAEEDKTLLIRQALGALPPNEAAVLRIPPGTWHFWPDRAAERHYFISNNDCGLKRIVFPLVNSRHLTIDGQGAEFIFHGHVTPFVLDGASHVTLRDLTIDYDRPFFTQGEIINAGPEHVDLCIDRENYPCRVENGRLVFSGPTWDGAGFQWVMLLVQFDPATRMLASNRGYHIGRFLSLAHIDPTHDSWAMKLEASENADGTVRLTAAWGDGMEPGNMLVLGHEHRLDPAVLVTDSADVRLENITIHHAGAMGVIAQLSRDITLDGVQIALRPGTDRMVSTLADATHFVNCEGTVALENCVFENMLDDGTNIHGIYTTVSHVLAPDTLELELMHFQQHGIQLYRPGDTVTFVNRETLLPIQTAVVRNARLVNRERIEVTFTEPVEDSVAVGDAVDNTTRFPEIIIRGCRTGHNRPRGVLLSSHRKTVVEDNTFYNSSSGVTIAGDANYWFEAGPVGDLTIRCNRFLSCGYADGAPAIVIAPEIPGANDDTPCYHRNITIEQNEFQTDGRPVVFARSVDGLRMVNNTYAEGCPTAPAERVKLDHCREVQLEEG